MTDSTDFELHFYKTNYMGPGTDLDKRLNEDGTPKAEYAPTDRIDQLAYEHDMFYKAHTGWKDRMESDIKLINDVKLLKNLTCKERLEKYVVIICIGAKVFFTRAVLYCLGQ